jgi:cytochrome d ubiquinol oxidase subunit I
MMFIVSTLYASYLRFRDRLFEKRWLLWYFVFAILFAFAGNEAGWVTAEVGRQPWIVYPTLHDGQLGGGLRTSHGLSEAVTAEQVLGSIIMFAVIYLSLFVLWIMLLNGKIQKGPEPVAPTDHPSLDGAIDAATRLVDHKSSLTEAKQP